MAPYRPTGFSLPWFGVSWEHVKDQDKATARAVLAFLEDRRVLFGDRHLEDEIYCLRSVASIRTFLTDRLTSDDIGDDLASILRAMRASCRAFIEAAGPEAIHFRHRNHNPYETDPFSIALGDLRSRFGFYLAAVLQQHNLSIEDDLARILPPPPAPEDDDLSWVPGF